MKKNGIFPLKRYGVLFLVGVVFFGGIGMAETSCIDNYLLSGETKGLVRQSYLYQFLGSGDEISEDASIFFLLDNKKINDSGNSVLHTFEKAGTFTLKAQLKSSECNSSLEKTITIFDKNILYLGTPSDFLNFGFEEGLNKAGYLFTKLFSLKEKKTDSEMQIPFANAEIVIINDKDFQPLLEKYLLIKNTSILPLQKQFIIITDVNKNLLKRSLAQYAKSLTNDTITIIHPSNFMNLLSDISLGKKYQEQTYSTQFSREFKDTPKWMVISYLVDELLKTGFPLQILGLLLSLSVVVLIISFSRQIIGLGVFGVYWPMLFALIATIGGLEIILFLFGIALLTSMIMRGIAHHFYLLHSSKVSLLITLFLILFLLGATISEKFGIQILGASLFKTWLIFPLLLSVLIVDKTFTHFRIWTTSRWINLVEFVLISSLSYAILQRDLVSNMLLSFPELLLLLLVINFIIGRFAGLQLLELMRFMPLIRKHLDEEEEE